MKNGILSTILSQREEPGRKGCIIVFFELTFFLYSCCSFLAWNKQDKLCGLPNFKLQPIRPFHK